MPFGINNDGFLSRQAAQTLFASLCQAESSAATPAKFVVLELGIGVGLFARLFLDAFKQLCAENGKDFYQGLLYVAGDKSERMLADASRHGVFASHAGHYALRVLDAMTIREADLRLPASHRGAPVVAVFLNYLLDCLPAADLRVADGEVRQLYARTCLARNAPLAEYSQLKPQDLVRRAQSGTPADQRALLRLYSLIGAEYDYRPLAGGESGKLPYLDFAVRFAQDHGGHLLHNYGAIASLEHLLEILDPRGFILINDYGQTELKDQGEFEHQRFSNATFVGINFPLLKAFFGDGRGKSWIEPGVDSGRIHSRLLGHKIDGETATVFGERFSKAAYEWAEEPVRRARGNLQHGRVEPALSAYHQALERQPNNWMLMNEIAHFLTFTVQNPSAGAGMAKAALALNPACSADLWNTLGDAYFEMGRQAQAKSAFQRALGINPSDVKARYNLAWALEKERDYKGALALIAEAFALDETSEYFERLSKKQAQILERLNRRNQQRMFLLANRVSSRAGGEPPPKPGDEQKGAG